MIVADVFSDIQALLGPCQDTAVYAQVTDAVELLSNEMYQDATGQWRSWDALEGYLVVPVQSGNLLVLPSDVETPIRININDAPAMARGKLFEFMPNGPGSAAGDRQVISWQDQGTSPTSVLLTGATSVGFRTAVANTIFITGYDFTNARVENYPVPVAYDGRTFERIDSISKPGATAATLYGTPQNGEEITYANFGAKDVNPLYRVLRLSSSGATVRMLYRRRTFQVASQQDYIPLNSRLAVLFMAKAIRRGLIEDFNPQAEALQAKALELLKKEQLSRHAADLLAQTQQIDRTMGRNPNAGDLVTAYDLYDDAADIYGPIGQDRIFEYMTEAVRLLARKGSWDSLLAYVEVPVSGNMISLPAEVDSFLRISVDASPVRFAGRLWEFSLNGPGENEVYTDATVEERGDSPLFVTPVAPFQLSQQAGGTRTITVCGTSTAGDAVTNFVVTTNASDSPQFASVDTVQVSLGANAADVAVLLSGGVTIARYSPADTNPIYRQLKLRKGGQSARVLFRRKTAQIHSLTDFIPLRSRMAVVLMMKSMKAALDGNSDAASALETQAVQYLSEEQSVRSAAEAVAAGEQVDRALNLNMRARDVLTVFDIYDDCAAILGEVGRQFVFDAIAQAEDLLSNASEGAWDSQMGFADLLTGDGYTFALPAEVGDILAVNICGVPARPRNRWIEYNLNGPGQYDGRCAQSAANDCCAPRFAPSVLEIRGTDGLAYRVDVGTDNLGNPVFDLSTGNANDLSLPTSLSFVGRNGQNYQVSVYAGQNVGPELIVT